MQNLLKCIGLAFFVLIISCANSTPKSKKMYDEAIVSWGQGKKEEAIEKLTGATKDNPKYYEAHLKLGEFYSSMEEHTKATESLETAIKIKPEDAEAYLIAGEVYLQIATEDKEYLKAQHKFSTALELPKMDVDQTFRANLGKGVCLLKRTLIEDARPFLEKAKQIKPQSLESIFYQALLSETLSGPNKQAISMYESILAQQPNHLGALKQLGDIYRKLSYIQKAITYYQKFLNSNGKSSDIAEFVQQNKIKKEEVAVIPEEKIMVCPECGRIGKKGDTNCVFDAVVLVEQTKSSG